MANMRVWTPSRKPGLVANRGQNENTRAILCSAHKGHKQRHHHPAVRGYCASFGGKRGCSMSIGYSDEGSLHVGKRILAAKAKHGTRVDDTAVSTESPSFLDDLRKAAMNLHTRDQSAEGGQEPQRRQFIPTREGYMRFLIDSRIIFSTMEEIIENTQDERLSTLKETGLERTAALDKDIAFLSDLDIQPSKFEGSTPGMEYARYLQDLSSENVPGFICHYYNTYFAHTAGGKMIGKAVSDSVLDGHKLEFYKFEGKVPQLLKEVKARLENIASGWSEGEKEKCLGETGEAFKFAGKVLSQITSSS